MLYLESTLPVLDGRQLLVDYLRGELRHCAGVQSLGNLLTWHDLPHPYHLANVNYSGRPDIFNVFSVLPSLSGKQPMSVIVRRCHYPFFLAD